MLSLCQAEDAVIPATTMPRLAWARDMPQAPRGRLRASVRLLAKGARNNAMRSANWTIVPATSQPASAMPKAAGTWEPAAMNQVTVAMANATAAAALSRAITGARSARFHGSKAPMTQASRTGTMIGTKVALKNGGPTDTLPPPNASRISGYRVPSSTTAAAVVSSRLFSTRAPSREIGANNPPPASPGARTA